MTNEEKERFYSRVAEILGIEHEFSQTYRRTRWNKRNLGNGRFPGFGLVQLCGPVVRIVTRAGTKTFTSEGAACKYLEEIKPR